MRCRRQVHLGRRPCADDLNLREIAFETQRTSGAQLANLVNLAASFVGRAGRDRITQADLLQVRVLGVRVRVRARIRVRVRVRVRVRGCLNTLKACAWCSNSKRLS